MHAHTIANDFSGLAIRLRDLLIDAPLVDVGEWQSLRDGTGAVTAELEDVSIDMLIPQTAFELGNMTNANLPWAEDHFQERVSGIPHNPPPSSAYWPYAQRAHEQHVTDTRFSHTYPERFWPKDGPSDDSMPMRGLRFAYGDLNDVVTLLRERPGTRQAYIPIWFPEDTGAVHGERVPCTLGYHVMIRQHMLSIRYFMRSCDFIRHFRDDVYMAGRLAQWIAGQVGDLTVHRLVMHISSLHVFAPSDIQLLTHKRRTGR